MNPTPVNKPRAKKSMCTFTKILVNRHSYFRARGFLTGVDVMGDIGLLLVNPSGVETIAASRISLNFC